MNKPNKIKIFPVEVIENLRTKAIDFIKAKFLPDEKIIKIVLVGSSVKESFGEYEPPGVRGSLFSDFDFIIFVEDDYIIPDWLDKEPTGKPFPDDKLNLAYRNKNLVEEKYDIEIFFIRRKNMDNPEIKTYGEQAGIPMTLDSKHKHIIVYEK